MNKTLPVIAILFSVSSAKADDIVVNEKLWNELTAAIGQVAMPMPAHQNVQSILRAVRDQAAKDQAAKDQTAKDQAPK